MALKKFINDSNPVGGTGIRRWSSQSDLMFQKSKNPDFKDPERNKAYPVPTFKDNCSLPGMEKSIKWGDAADQAKKVLKSLSETFSIDDLEFPMLKSQVVAKLIKGLPVPEKYIDIASTELQKSKNVNDLKYRLALLAKGFGVANTMGVF